MKFKISKKLIIAMFVIPGSSFVVMANAGWQDLLNQADKVLKGSDSSGSVATSLLSNDQISGGLKEALQSGVETAINYLGKDGGFLKDQAVKIMMPEKLQQAEKLLRSFGQEKLADDFVLSMNRAAEQAVPKVTNIFTDAISKMTLSDANTILQGPDDAATEYFKKHTSEQLKSMIEPLVKESMESNQVTKYYNTMMDTVKKYDTMGLVSKYLGEDAGQLDNYVTNKTMDGLFTKIAAQEKLIRDNPVARSTELMKEVFGSVTK